MTEVSSDPAAPSKPVLSGSQKAAVILSLLDPGTAREIASRFDDGHAEKAVEAFRTLPMLDGLSLREAVESYLRALEGPLPVVAGGARRAEGLEKVLLAPPDEDAPQETQTEGSLDDGAGPEAVWSYVLDLEPDKVAQLVMDERPGVIAAVIRQMDRSRAAAILAILPPPKAAEVIRITMAPNKPRPETMDAVAENLRREVPLRLKALSGSKDDPSVPVAAALNAVPARVQKAIIEPLKADAPLAAEALEDKLLSFALLHKALPKSIAPMIFREVDRKVLDPAMKHALNVHTETAEFLFASISQRLAEQIRERIEEHPPISADEGEDAQAELLSTLIDWSEEERFAFKPLTEGA